MRSESSNKNTDEMKYRLPHSFIKLFANFVKLVVDKINSAIGLGNINDEEWLKVYENVENESKAESDTDELEEKKDKVVDTKTWECICIMFPSIVKEEAIKTTLSIRDFSIQKKEIQKKENMLQSSHKNYMTFPFPFKAKDIELITAADNLSEASEVYYDESKNESIQDMKHEKRNGHTSATISDNELSRLKDPVAYLNDVLIDFWMLW